MRCQTCNHSLWNVRSRVCPECGTAFLPSQYNLRANAVEFCCGTCEQPYYGVGTHGLLDPRTFACVRCCVHCDMDITMFLRPAPGVGDDEAVIDSLPWPPVPGASRVKAAWAMFLAALGSPGRVGAALRGNHDVQPVLWLAYMSVPLIVGASATVFFFALASHGIGGGGAGDLVAWAFLAIALVLGPLLGVLALVAIFSALCWVVMRCADRELRYSEVFTCWAFAAAPVVFVAVPCLGPYCMSVAAAVWVPILAGMMLARCTRGGVTAVVLGVLIAVLAPMMLSAAALWFVGTMAPVWSSGMTTRPPAPTVSPGGVPPGVTVPSDTHAPEVPAPSPDGTGEAGAP